MMLKTEPTNKIMNAVYLAQLVSEIGPQTVEIVIRKAISDLKGLFYEIGPATEVQDWNALRVAVHSISGVSAIVGGERLRKISLLIEQNCIDGTIDEALTNVALLMLETMALIEKLERFRLNDLNSDTNENTSNGFQFA